MREGARAEKPTVVVMAAPDHPALREVLAGLEEQGVPGEVREASASDAGALANVAADASSLGVGLGLASDGSVAVTHRTLPPGQPVEHRAAPVPPDEARRLGAAAARIVVGLPLTT